MQIENTALENRGSPFVHHALFPMKITPPEAPWAEKADVYLCLCKCPNTSVPLQIASPWLLLANI